MNPVVIADLEVRFRPLTESERTNAQAWLDDAWQELLARVPGLLERQASGVLPDALVRRVVAAMVVRVLRNPEAIQRWGVDDATFTRDALVASGQLFVSPDEVALLSGVPVGPLPPLSFSAPYGGRW